MYVIVVLMEDTNMKYERLSQQRLEEYELWVTEHSRFPGSTSDAKFSDGGDMSVWRRNHPDIVNAFETEMKVIFAEFRRDEEDQKFYNRVVKYRKDSDPNTIKEYLDGNNRYKYFGIDEFDKITSYAGETDMLAPYVRLIREIYDLNMLWSEFHRLFNINTVARQIEDVLNELPNDSAQMIRHKFGLGNAVTMTLTSLSIKYKVSREDIRRIQAEAILKMGSKKYLSKIEKRFHAKEKKICNICGHWFVIRLHRKDGIHIRKLVKAHSYELDEVLSKLGYVSIPLNTEYNIYSVVTEDKYSWEIKSQIFREMSIPYHMLVESDTLYQITTVDINVDITQDFALYLEIYLEEMKRLERERKQEEKKREQERIRSQEIRRQEEQRIYDQARAMDKNINDYDEISRKFISDFSEFVKNTLDYLVLDDFYGWLDLFNRSISMYLIPDRNKYDAAKIVQQELNHRLRSFNLTCKFYQSIHNHYNLIVGVNPRE